MRREFNVWIVKLMLDDRREVKEKMAVRVIVLLLGLCLPGVVHAQVTAGGQGDPNQTWDAGRLQMTRSELEELLASFEQAGRSNDFSPAFRARAEAEAALVRARLTEGDFQVGDQITVQVEGEFEGAALTLTVSPAKTVTLPGMGNLSLVGVLRSELQGKVHEFVSRYIRNPVVQTRTLIRLAIIGQVQQPGFHSIPAEALLSEAIMVAGGPTGVAKFSDVRVERNGEKIWAGKVFQTAIAEGRTLDQMNIRSGDQLVVPMDGGGSATLLRALTIVPATLVAILGLVRAF